MTVLEALKKELEHWEGQRHNDWLKFMKIAEKDIPYQEAVTWYESQPSYQKCIDLSKEIRRLEDEIELLLKDEERTSKVNDELRDVLGLEKLDRIDENSDGASNRMYYFRGTTERNHIVFAGYCWRILRTNEDGSLRIRFNGPYSQSKGCLTTNGAENNTDITIGKTMFHINHSDFSNEDYVKYQVDKSGSMINSEVKQLLEEWYHENLVVEEHEGSGDYYSSKVADEFYCNDTYSFIDKDNNVVSGKYAAHSLVPMFKDPSNKNIYGYSNIVSTLTFKCNLLKDSANENERISTLEDAYDVSSQGNHKLIYPIGLLTAQDVVLAGGYLSNELDEYKGGKNGMDNESYYLYTGFNYWTMSPYSNLDNNPKMVYVNSKGRLSSASVKESSSNYYVIPVISLKSTVEIASGRGTAKSPYIVK